jgi:hypothetical protein
VRVVWTVMIRTGKMEGRMGETLAKKESELMFRKEVAKLLTSLGVAI